MQGEPSRASVVVFAKESSMSPFNALRAPPRAVMLLLAASSCFPHARAAANGFIKHEGDCHKSGGVVAEHLAQDQTYDKFKIPSGLELAPWLATIPAKFAKQGLAVLNLKNAADCQQDCRKKRDCAAAEWQNLGTQTKCELFPASAGVAGGLPGLTDESFDKAAWTNTLIAYVEDYAKYLLDKAAHPGKVKLWTEAKKAIDVIPPFLRPDHPAKPVPPEEPESPERTGKKDHPAGCPWCECYIREKKKADAGKSCTADAGCASESCRGGVCCAEDPALQFCAECDANTMGACAKCDDGYTRFHDGSVLKCKKATANEPTTTATPRPTTDKAAADFQLEVDTLRAKHKCDDCFSGSSGECSMMAGVRKVCLPADIGNKDTPLIPPKCKSPFTLCNGVGTSTAAPASTAAAATTTKGKPKRSTTTTTTTDAASASTTDPNAKPITTPTARACTCHIPCKVQSNDVGTGAKSCAVDKASSALCGDAVKRSNKYYSYAACGSAAPTTTTKPVDEDTTTAATNPLSTPTSKAPAPPPSPSPSPTPSPSADTTATTAANANPASAPTPTPTPPSPTPSLPPSSGGAAASTAPPAPATVATGAGPGTDPDAKPALPSASTRGPGGGDATAGGAGDTAPGQPRTTTTGEGAGEGPTLATEPASANASEVDGGGGGEGSRYVCVCLCLRCHAGMVLPPKVLECAARFPCDVRGCWSTAAHGHRGNTQPRSDPAVQTWRRSLLARSASSADTAVIVIAVLVLAIIAAVAVLLLKR